MYGLTRTLAAIFLVLGACSLSAVPSHPPLVPEGERYDDLDELLRLLAPPGSVTSVAFSPDGKILASASYDRTVRLWDVGSGEEIKRLEGHSDTVQAVAFNRDGKTLASGSLDSTVRLWDVGTGEETTRLEGHSARVRGVAFSPDGKTLASGSYVNLS